ncbi:minor extracellular serine protease Vpr [Alkalibacillus filiformis]|uniref:Minor extracellular serine protease Vpr n=1 Tax=Alkalibacillus filiformis TaxID=200990 RepID=A0ABU0DQ97_9BACI|nr:S8 family serine peptidase [Alkalibacillus filiformis]MDQ0350380.1 minor extracellular serine protease Vpr [Alkalibacillus filiformis]
MRKALSKPILILLTIMLVFGTMAFPNGDLQANSGDLQRLGTIHGEFDHDSEEPVTVIVELTERSVLQAKHNNEQQDRGDLAAVRQQVMDDVSEAAPSSEFAREYDYVFSGFSVEVKQNELRSLAAVDGIKAVYPNVEHQAEVIESTEIGAHEVSPNMMDSAPHIGADQAWDELGYTGEGVTVAVIDTGVDYTHPDLEHAFGEYKGWDFVDNNDDPQETPTDDPRGASTNHGSHVAGTVAANGLIKGVAPDASLLAYRVLGPGGSGTTDNVIAGIEQAIIDGADVMNLSLGNTSNDPDFATSLALDTAMADGVVAVASNGNSGPADWTVGSPGTSRDAISVGATQLPYTLFDVGLTSSESTDYETANVMGHPSEDALLALNGNNFEVEYVGLGSSEEVEEADLDGKIALIKRGDYPFVEKAANAAAAGAVGAIIFNNVDGEQPEIPGMAIPTIKMSLEDGETMLEEMNVEVSDNDDQNGNRGNRGNRGGNNKGDDSSNDYTISFNIEEVGLMGETVADFSSRGPVTESWMIKPDVSAPGVNITSTIPTHNPDEPHGYAAFQGTSMSAPHVAGAAALLVQAHGHWDTQQVKSALMNTSETLYDENGERYPHNTQGAGSIRIVEALQTETLVANGSYSYGTFEKDNGKQERKMKFDIENLTDERKRYNIDVEFFDGDDHIKVSTSNNLRVHPNSTQEVNVGVQVETSELEAGYYEGLITLSNNNETIEVPTILFIQDPYEVFPGLTALFDSGGFTLEDGIFDILVNLNVDVDYIETMIYTGGLAPIALIDVQEDLPEGENNYQIDANWALDQLPAGEYALIVWVGKEEHSEEGWILGYFDLE